MQLSREPASHESESDESNLSLQFVEFRYWHIGELSPRFLGIVPPDGAIGPHRCDLHVRCHLESIQNQAGIAWITLKTVKGLTLNDGQVARRRIAEPETS